MTGLAVADLVGDDGDEAGRHLGEVDIGVADRGADGPGDFADVDDAHGAQGLLVRMLSVTKRPLE